MSKNEPNANYTANPDLGDLEIVPDFLPRPEDLVFRSKGVVITTAFSERSVAFFKEQAARLDVPYQRMIHNLIDEYVRRIRRSYAVPLGTVLYTELADSLTV